MVLRRYKVCAGALRFAQVPVLWTGSFACGKARPRACAAPQNDSFSTIAAKILPRQEQVGVNIVRPSELH